MNFFASSGWGAFLGWMDDSAAQIGWDEGRDPIFPGWALETHVLDDRRFFFRPTGFVQWTRDKPSWIREYRPSSAKGWIDSTWDPSGEPVRGLGGDVRLPDAVILEQMQRRVATLIADAWRGLSRRQRSTLVACYERGLSPGWCP